MQSILTFEGVKSPNVISRGKISAVRMNFEDCRSGAATIYQDGVKTGGINRFRDFAAGIGFGIDAGLRGFAVDAVTAGTPDPATGKWTGGKDQAVFCSQRINSGRIVFEEQVRSQAFTTRYL